MSKSGDRRRHAPEGTIWVCPACGRTGKDRYELGDTSCVTWANLCKEDSVVYSRETGKAIKAEAWNEHDG